MPDIQAVVVDPTIEGRLKIDTVPAPQPLPNEALIRVSAISLNLGEVRRALTMAEAGFRPGWDIAGTIEQAAADGSAPPAGARVVGWKMAGAWAQLVAVPTDAIAALPPGVSDAQASTLPVAGVTALYSLDIYGDLLGRNVLVDGASGGVGHLAVQLARHGGAHVVASVRRPERERLASDAGAHEVVVGEDLAPAAAHGPYDCVLDSLGGRALGQAMTMLALNGMCINYGVSAGAETTFSVRDFFFTGGASLYGFVLFHEILRWPMAAGLQRLVALVEGGALVPPIEREAPWADLPRTAHALYNREIPGKAVILMP